MFFWHKWHDIAQETGDQVNIHIIRASNPDKASQHFNSKNRINRNVTYCSK
jgi:hypothetical protein